MRLIRDILPPMNREDRVAFKRMSDEQYLIGVETDIIIKELYERGVTIRDVFGRFYELEEASNGRTMTIEDASLVVPR